MSNDLNLLVSTRETKGKNSNRQLRAAGLVPAVVYGGGKEAVSIQVESRKMQDLLRHSDDNPLFLLELEGTGKSRHAMIREMQTDSITGQMIHIDFQRVLLDQKVHLAVSIELHGTPVGVKVDGGMLDFVTREVEVECLPTKIPAHLDLDVSELKVGQHVEASELDLPEGVTLLDDGHRTIVSISTGRIAEEESAEDDDLLEQVSSEPEVLTRKSEE